MVMVVTTELPSVRIHVKILNPKTATRTELNTNRAFCVSVAGTTSKSANKECRAVYR